MEEGGSGNYDPNPANSISVAFSLDATYISALPLPLPYSPYLTVWPCASVMRPSSSTCAT